MAIRGSIAMNIDLDKFFISKFLFTSVHIKGGFNCHPNTLLVEFGEALLLLHWNL